MARQRVTIREIAAAAGVSTSAVSYVLNGRKGVSVETRERVQEVINRYGYQPNINSVRLVSQRSFNIRVAIQRGSSPFEDLFFYEIAQGVLEGSSRAGYNIVFSHIGSKSSDRMFLDSVQRGDADGIVFFLDVNPGLLYAIRETGVPAVVIDGHVSDDSVTQVRADYALAAETATGHLIEMGHRRLCLLASSQVRGFFDQVFSGFQTAAAQAGLVIPAGWVHRGVNDENTAAAAVSRLFESGSRPDGIVCASDIIALGAIREIKRLGCTVPDDISVIGIDDIVLSRYVEPALSTIRIDKKSMGEAAVELLMELMAGREVAGTVIRSDVLVERSSVHDRR